ncbi:hypothetical protein [Paenibacillus sp. FSL R10-2734]|uniref:hypothetical protein n=1 Tax=Paenibacillus sp. FSL R10-2734 TaxID=2954691 RepID=UPI0030DCCEDB
MFWWTRFFEAQTALYLAEEQDVTIAIYKQDKSSCGNLLNYDGSFTNREMSGKELQRSFCGSTLQKCSAKAIG